MFWEPQAAYEVLKDFEGLSGPPNYSEVSNKISQVTMELNGSRGQARKEAAERLVEAHTELACCEEFWRRFRRREFRVSLRLKCMAGHSVSTLQALQMKTVSLGPAEPCTESC